MMAAFSIAYGRTKEHADALKLGLSKMPPDFCAIICQVCDGEGQYRQTYCDGPNGYFKTMGGCDYCDGTGLLQGRKPAPASVRAQVLTQAER
jgi:DnaJ-class molecular chaperone